MDALANVLVEFGTLVVAIWAATEYLPRAIKPLRRIERDLLAILLGPIFGVVAYVVGFVGAGGAEGWRGYAAAGFAGLLGTIIAGVGHDKLVLPVVGKKKEG